MKTPTRTVKDLADFLQVHPNTVYQLVKSGRIGHTRIGYKNAIRFTDEDVEEFLENSGSKTPTTRETVNPARHRFKHLKT